MAYMNQEKKAKIAGELKRVVPAGWKYSLSVRHHSTIVLTISAAPVDLIAEVNACNAERARQRGDEPYINRDSVSIHPSGVERSFSASRDTIAKIMACLNIDNHDRSDVQSDYFDVGHYVDLQIGRWDKPFKVA